MTYSNTYSNFNGNPCYTPISFWILLTRHIITLTNLVYRIGLIQINTCSSPNTMNKTGIIITTLHRTNGDTTPPSHIVNHLTNTQLHILLLLSNHQKNQLTDKRGWEPQKSLSDEFKFQKTQNPVKIFKSLLLYLSRRTYQLRKEYGIHDSIPK